MNLRISESHYDKMRRLLAPSFLGGRRARPETGCILLIALNRYPENTAVIVNDVLEPGPGDFDRQEHSALSFSSQYLRRALLAARQRRLDGFITVHSHPLADERVGFSGYDDSNDPELMANLYDLQPGGTFGSLVVGKRSLKGRIWTPKLHWLDLDDLIVVGSRYLTLPISGVAKINVPTPAAIFDRGLAISGAGALHQMSRMRFGVVGVSGTGSIVVELLIRAGAGTIVLFEPDIIDEPNLNRILYSRKSDAEKRVSKTERVLEVIGESGMPTRIVVIEGGDIRDPNVANHLRGCDLIFGCVDKDWPRLILSEVAYQYLVPVIDMGTEIGISADGSELQSVDARVSYVVPGNPCLSCTGIVTAEGLRLEGLSEEELERTIGQGYCKDIRLKAPAVMDLNMRAASSAMLLMRHLLQPFMATPLPTSIHESLTSFATKKRFESPQPGCLICGLADRLGSGARFKLSTRDLQDVELFGGGMERLAS